MKGPCNQPRYNITSAFTYTRIRNKLSSYKTFGLQSHFVTDGHRVFARELLFKGGVNRDKLPGYLSIVLSSGKPALAREEIPGEQQNMLLCK